MSQWLFLEPHDVLHFRDGSPFDAGQQHGARSLFPPFPGTVAGALRAAILWRRWGREPQSKERWNQLVREVQEVELSLGPPVVARRTSADSVEPFWSPPRDLLVHFKDDDPDDHPSASAVARPLSEELVALTDLPAPIRPVGVASVLRHEPWTSWLSSTELSQVLQGDAPRQLQPRILWDHEPRTGVGLTSAKTAQEGLLYQIAAVRPRPQVGLAVEVKSKLPKELSSSPATRLGGEGRLTGLQWIQPPALPKPGIPKDGRFKLYLSSPLVGLATPQWPGATLVGALLGRPEAVGGWDLQKQAPREMKQAFPAGSILFFEGATEDALRGLHPGIWPGQTETTSTGFGHFFVGTW